MGLPRSSARRALVSHRSISAARPQPRGRLSRFGTAERRAKAAPQQCPDVDRFCCLLSTSRTTGHGCGIVARGPGALSSSSPLRWSTPSVVSPSTCHSAASNYCDVTCRAPSSERRGCADDQQPQHRHCGCEAPLPPLLCLPPPIAMTIQAIAAQGDRTSPTSAQSPVHPIVPIYLPPPPSSALPISFHPQLHFSSPALSPSASLRVLLSTLLLALSSIPICLTLNAAAISSHPLSLFLVSVLILSALLALLALLWTSLHTHTSTSTSAPSPPLFLPVFCLFTFSSFIDLLLSITAHSLHPLTSFYLTHGELYLSSPHGAAINLFDGTCHLALYLSFIDAITTATPYHTSSIVWCGSILNSLVVLILGAVVGYGGVLQWSMLLNVPYIVLPLLMAYRRWEQREVLVVQGEVEGEESKARAAEVTATTAVVGLAVVGLTVGMHVLRASAALSALLAGQGGVAPRWVGAVVTAAGMVGEGRGAGAALPLLLPSGPAPPPHLHLHTPFANPPPLAFALSSPPSTFLAFHRLPHPDPCRCGDAGPLHVPHAVAAAVYHRFRRLGWGREQGGEVGHGVGGWDGAGGRGDGCGGGEPVAGMEGHGLGAESVESQGSREVGIEARRQTRVSTIVWVHLVSSSIAAKQPAKAWTEPSRHLKVARASSLQSGSVRFN